MIETLANITLVMIFILHVSDLLFYLYTIGKPRQPITTTHWLVMLILNTLFWISIIYKIN